MTHRFTPQLERDVALRGDSSDEQTWIDTFEVGYHVPPEIHPDGVLDLGANIGLTAAHYATIWPRVPICAVEMDYENAALCERNFGDVVNCAVGTFSGEATYARKDWKWEASYSLTRPGEVTVQVRTIPELIDQFLSDSEFIFCKMDIEGTEWEVLAQPIDERIHWLLVELHGEDPAEEMIEHGKQLLIANEFAVATHSIHPHAIWAER